jgi:hypothetical protein
MRSPLVAEEQIQSLRQSRQKLERFGGGIKRVQLIQNRPDLLAQTLFIFVKQITMTDDRQYERQRMSMNFIGMIRRGSNDRRLAIAFEKSIKSSRQCFSNFSASCGL